MSASMQMFVHVSKAEEMALPASEPLLLTRNFTSVLLFCLATLAIAPFLIAWVASVLLPV